MSLKKNRLIKFNPQKHDEKVEGRRASEEQIRAGEIILRVGRAWEQKTRALRKNNKATADDLKKLMAEMEVIVEKECGMVKALDPFRRFTLLLIREKAELLRLSDFNERNVFTPAGERLPLTEQGEIMEAELPAAEQKPVVRYTFKELGEFELLEPVRRVKLAPGHFVGFVLDTNQVLAVFADGSFEVIGAVLNGIGLEKMPSREQYVAGLKKKGQA